MCWELTHGAAESGTKGDLRQRGLCRAGPGSAPTPLRREAWRERPYRDGVAGVGGRKKSLFLFSVGHPSSDLHFQKSSLEGRSGLGAVSLKVLP